MESRDQTLFKLKGKYFSDYFSNQSRLNITLYTVELVKVFNLNSIKKSIVEYFDRKWD